MRGFFLIIIVTILVLPVKPAPSQSQIPLITNNNPEYIDGISNPIALNWTVIDDNLMEHMIYQFETLIDYQNYTSRSLDLKTYSIFLEFILGNGKYEFTLIVRDFDNQTEMSTISIQKGTDPPSIPTLPLFQPYLFLLGILVMVIIKKAKS